MSTFPNLRSVVKDRPVRYYASTVFEDIKQHLQDMRYGLKEDEDILATVPLADGRIITVAMLGYRNPNFIIVGGPDNHGNRTYALIPHTSIQVIMDVLKKEPGKPRHNIGFQYTDSQEVPPSEI